MAEWLRRWTWNPMGSSRAGSNPARSDTFLQKGKTWPSHNIIISNRHQLLTYLKKMKHENIRNGYLLILLAIFGQILSKNTHGMEIQSFTLFVLFLFLLILDAIFSCNDQHRRYWPKNWHKNILPGGESNPGLPRDRRGYLPLYYRGHIYFPTFLVQTHKHILSENVTPNSCVLKHPRGYSRAVRQKANQHVSRTPD